MLKLVVFSCLLAVAIGKPFDGKVINGTTADILEYPYIVSFGINGHHICGGAILDYSTIITSGFCTEGMDILISVATIRAGSTDSVSGGQLVKVAKIIKHENFNMHESMDNDIAILKLATPLTPGDGVQPIVVNAEEVPSKTDCVVSGWGVTSPNSHQPEQNLRQVSLTTIDNKACEDAYKGRGIITSNMMCTSTPFKDACIGDSGGPLVSKGKLVGLVSWGIGCAELHSPGIFTRVSNYASWIEKHRV